MTYSGRAALITLPLAAKSRLLVIYGVCSDVFGLFLLVCRVARALPFSHPPTPLPHVRPPTSWPCNHRLKPRRALVPGIMAYSLAISPQIATLRRQTLFFLALRRRALLLLLCLAIMTLFLNLAAFYCTQRKPRVSECVYIESNP